MRVGLAQIDCWVGDLEGNVGRCGGRGGAGRPAGAELVVLPELAVTGYPPRDLLFDDSFVAAALEATSTTWPSGWPRRPPVVVGSVARAATGPPRHPGLHNVAAVLEEGRVAARVAKRLLPAYDVFHEPRWFLPGGAQAPVELAGHRVGLLVCEDLWDEGYPVHPPAELRAAGAELLVCLAALPFRRGNAGARLHHARRAGLPVVHVSAVGAQDELIFDGRSFVLDADGEVVAQLPAFAEAVEVVEVPVGSRTPGGRGSTSTLRRILEEPVPGDATQDDSSTICTTRWSSASAASSRRTASGRAFLGLSGRHRLRPRRASRRGRPRSRPRAGGRAPFPPHRPRLDRGRHARWPRRWGSTFEVVPLESLHEAAEESLATVRRRDPRGTAGRREPPGPAPDGRR